MAWLGECSFLPKKEEKDPYVMAQLFEELDNYPIQSLNLVLEQIYVEHKYPWGFFKIR